MFCALLVVSGLVVGENLEVLFQPQASCMFLSAFTSVQLFRSVSMILSPHASIFHLFPLTPPPPSFSCAPQPPPCRQTQCQHDVGLAQCVRPMGKKKSLNMQKGPFNPHLYIKKNLFFVAQHYQLNRLVLEMKKRSVALHT